MVFRAPSALAAVTSAGSGLKAAGPPVPPLAPPPHAAARIIRPAPSVSSRGIDRLMVKASSSSLAPRADAVRPSMTTEPEPPALPIGAGVDPDTMHAEPSGTFPRQDQVRPRTA